MSLTQETMRLEAAQIDRASATLARAFQDDPMMRYVLPNDARRARLLPWNFSVLLRYCLPYGEVLTTPDLSGVACWLPPGSGTKEAWGMLRSGMVLAPLRLGPAAFVRFMGLTAYMDAARERIVPTPHWHLFGIGVEPSRQGEGIGGALLDPALARADAHGLPCYLETQTERNVEFYEKRGFKVSEASTVRGLRVWTMLRTPQSPTTAIETQPEAPRKEDV
ncbi:MAG: GNAT family N-acetyltransferase [Actinomycetota bacterium]|nr:GNAT family N-acetyltransferase [Actinomycetota bacterium]